MDWHLAGKCGWRESAGGLQELRGDCDCESLSFVKARSCARSSEVGCWWEGQDERGNTKLVSHDGGSWVDGSLDR